MQTKVAVEATKVAQYYKNMMRWVVIVVFLFAHDSFAEVYALVQNPNGSILLITETGFLQITNNLKVEQAAIEVKAEQIHSLAFDQTRVLWIGAEEGLFRCANNSCQIDSRVQEPVRSLAIGPDQSFWIATDKEVLKLDNKGSISKPFTNRVEALATDPEGSIWLGSGHELIHFNQAKQSYTLPPPPANVRMRPPVTSILVTKSKMIYVGTRSMGLLQLNGQTFKKVYDAEVLALLEDNKGNLWMGTSEGLSRMKNGKWMKVLLPQQ